MKISGQAPSARAHVPLRAACRPAFDTGALTHKFTASSEPCVEAVLGVRTPNTGRVDGILGKQSTAYFGISALVTSLRIGRPRPKKRMCRQMAEVATATTSEQTLARFRLVRNLTFCGMVVGYAVYYFTRLSFNYVGLAMRRDLGLSMVQIGAISSMFPIAYMNSKFVSGFLSDVLGSPVRIFGLGLMLTGFSNLVFATGNNVPFFTAVWVANGLFQGCGATPCNKMLVNWYPARSRGKWWSGWNASHNIGGFGIPLLAGGLAAAYSWRVGMVVPGLIAIVIGWVCLFMMKDAPEKIGLPTAEEYGEMVFGGPGKPAPAKNTEASKTPQTRQPVWRLLLGNRFLWCMAAMHFFIYFVRQGALNWAHFYIMDSFGVPAMEATARVSGFELGGLLGCIISGQLSDYLISKYPEKGAAGLRTQVMVCYSLLGTVSVIALWVMPAVAVLQWLAMALFGFAIYGPQTLITMTGVETVPRGAAATAGGLLAYPAQLGSICAGLPFAYLVEKYGWQGFFPALVFFSLCSTVAAIPGWKEPSYLQREAEKGASDA